MSELLVYCVPSAVYLLVQGRPGRLGLPRAARRLGAVWGTRAAYLQAAALLLPVAALGALSLTAIPAAALSRPGVSIATTTSAGALLDVGLRDLGEELFFRGLLGGVLVRRLGFARGNLAQAGLFLVPHLALLLADVALWPILPVQLAVGWLMGWLRTTSGSFLPGALVHAAANIGAGLVVT